MPLKFRRRSDIQTIEKKYSNLQEALRLVAYDLERAIALHKMFEQCAYMQVVPKAFDESERAHGFIAVRDALLVELVITLMRIHDSARPDNASIDNIMSIVADWRIRERLMHEAVEAHRKRHVSILPVQDRRMSEEQRQQFEADLLRAAEEKRDRDAPLECDNVARWLDEAFVLYEKLQQESARKSLWKLRNWHMAHRTLGDRKAGARYGDEKLILDLTVPLVTRLALAVNGTDYDFPEIDENWKGYAKVFWHYIGGISPDPDSS